MDDSSENKREKDGSNTCLNTCVEYTLLLLLKQRPLDIAFTTEAYIIHLFTEHGFNDQ
jgi:hypothetical protein